MGTRPTLWTEELLDDPHVAADKSRRVRDMFNAIAGRYSLVNSIFSGGRDSHWRRRAAALAGVTPEDRVLDVACGPGDFAHVFQRCGAAQVVACDFAHEMLTLGIRRNGADLLFCEANALRLPFADESFTLVSCAFGVRNFDDLAVGLAEMHRVLCPAGRAVILEFTRPARRVTRRLYDLYASYLMPRAASWISGDRTGAYRYLPRSVVSFCDAAEFCAKLHGAGFEGVSATPMTGGIVTVYLATRGTTR